MDDNQHWPDRIWIVGETHAKRRSHKNEPGAVAYVRADAYDELLEWCNTMIVGGEVCPCTMPKPISESVVNQELTAEPTPSGKDGGVG